MNTESRNDIDVKSYRARTLQGALLRVRKELGPDASVLETREVWDGPLGQRGFEVLASDRAIVPSRFSGPASDAESIAYDAQDRHDSHFIAAVSDSDDNTAFILPAHTEDLRGRLLTGLRESSEGWQSSLADIPRSANVDDSEFELELEPEWPLAFRQMLSQLTEANMDVTTACDLLRQVEDEGFAEDAEDLDALQQSLTSFVQQELSVRGPLKMDFGRQQVVALVGPTGMGKTTTVAKLAAHFKLVEHGRVGLITLDTYRVGAVDQLRTYAEIMDLPLVVASTPEEMQQGIDKLSNCDLVLIDTAGCSPQDESRVRDLEGMLQAAQPDDVQLVVGATLSPAAMQLTTERFAQAGAKAMVVTKLDEASGLGDLLRANRESQLPFTYVCEGQEVPNDIRAADATELAERIVGFAPRGGIENYRVENERVASTR